MKKNKHMFFGLFRMLGIQSFVFLATMAVFTAAGFPFVLASAVNAWLIITCMGTIGWLLGWGIAYYWMRPRG